MGDYGCFSFFPSKNLGGAGDGGMVTTNEKRRADRISCLRGHGAKPKYFHQLIGGNFRLDALQAAVLLVKLRYLDKWTARRQEHARRYLDLFRGYGLSPDICQVTSIDIDDGRHVVNQFVIRVPRRDGLRDHLKTCRIGCEVYYPRCMHEHECFAELGYKGGDFPKAEQAAKEVLALPIYAELGEEQIVCVVEKIRGFFV